MEVSLDVSMLEPCEPVDRKLESVEQLKEGDYLFGDPPQGAFVALPVVGAAGILLPDAQGRAFGLSGPHLARTGCGCRVDRQ